MAKIRNETRVPTSFEMYLACELLLLNLSHINRLHLSLIIEAHCLNKPISPQFTEELRKHWFYIITLGLTNEQINELVNSQR